MKRFGHRMPLPRWIREYIFRFERPRYRRGFVPEHESTDEHRRSTDTSVDAGFDPLAHLGRLDSASSIYPEIGIASVSTDSLEDSDGTVVASGDSCVTNGGTPATSVSPGPTPRWSEDETAVGTIPKILVNGMLPPSHLDIEIDTSPIAPRVFAGLQSTSAKQLFNPDGSPRRSNTISRSHRNEYADIVDQTRHGHRKRKSRHAARMSLRSTTAWWTSAILPLINERAEPKKIPSYPVWPDYTAEIDRYDVRAQAEQRYRKQVAEERA